MHPRRPEAKRIDPSFLLDAYRHGFFPMADEKTGEIGWYSPDPRGVFELSEFRVPRSLKQVIRKNLFEIRVSSRFEEVIRGCAGRKKTWISEDIIQSYLELHRLGYAHSVESWSGGSLSGGLYGVAIGGAFFGESMFSGKEQASKVALVALIDRLKEKGFELLDSQFVTPHLEMFGAKEIGRDEYLIRLRRAIRKTCKFG